ncbi:MAG: Wzz/FepE/Etk N-terminal domain-containing protein [Candidatus Gastranaerophilales bacterium]|nr:Wzz/FepE/Etk N-terminal domain-containing protein [Candidatus Gastranaerophilales bacterium]
MEYISLQKYMKLITKDWKIIACFMAGMLFLAVLYGLFLYKPIYESNAKILIKNRDVTTFVVDLGNNSEYSPSGLNQNPILTQIEILSSDDMAENVYNKLTKSSNFELYPKNQMILALKKSLKLTNPPGTEIIEISVLWHNADEAQKIAQTYQQSYIEYNVGLNKKSISQKKLYIKGQLDKSSKKLNQIRDQIKEYRNANFSVDIEKEAQSVIDQITNIEDQIATVDSQLKSETSKNSSLSNKLNVEVKEAIKSVAIGNNSNLMALQKNLQDTQQQYATLNVKYPPTNVQMKSLTENIKEIKRQIKSQMLANIGKSFENKPNSIIADPVRMKMVDDLIASQVNLDSCTAQKQSLESTLSELKIKQNAIPEKQKNLQSLIQAESITAQVVETLSTKLIEAQVRESEIVSGINIIDKPSLPLSEGFPTMFHIILMLEFVGMLLGLITILGLYYIQDLCQGIEELEEIIKSSVFGVIPWISDSNYKDVGNNYNPMSILSIAYQKIVTSLKIKCYKKDAKIIAFSSAEFEKNRSIISVNVAKTLAKSNNSVVLLDADFRDGCIEKEFNINKSKTSNLTNLLMQLCTPSSRHNPELIEALLQRALINVEGEPNLSIILNKNLLDNPYEIISSEAFPFLIEYLKNKFDYVIVDTPPILAVPDSITVSQFVDGLVILCGIKTSRSKLRKIQKICADNYIEILGAIARDSNTEYQVPESQYIKQLNFEDDDDIQHEAI